MMCLDPLGKIGNNMNREVIQPLQGFEMCVISKSVIRILPRKFDVVKIVRIGGRVAFSIACCSGLMHCIEGESSIYQGGMVVGPIYQGIVVGWPANNIFGKLHGREIVSGENKIILGASHKEL